MAGRKRQPVDLVAARGKKHLTKDEIASRKSAEVKIPEHLKHVSPPDFISGNGELCAAFERYARMIRDVMPDNFCQLDADFLADYVVFRSEYESATNRIASAESLKEEQALVRIQRDALDQARKAASSLCLTLADRCKLEVPGAGPDDGGAFDI